MHKSKVQLHNFLFIFLVCKLIWQGLGFALSFSLNSLLCVFVRKSLCPSPLKVSLPLFREAWKIGIFSYACLVDELYTTHYMLRSFSCQSVISNNVSIILKRYNIINHIHLNIVRNSKYPLQHCQMILVQWDLTPRKIIYPYGK